MAQIQNLLQDVKEGRISLYDVSVMLGSKNPEEEYTPDMIEVMELMALENEARRNFDEMAQDAEAAYYNQLADISDNGRIVEAGFINDL